MKMAKICPKIIIIVSGLYKKRIFFIYFYCGSISKEVFSKMIVFYAQNLDKDDRKVFRSLSI
jgi:adenosylmethionine-8-amino-7-oxononanoate aminotransferase